jgi:Pectate lyase superfamily protein
MPDIDDHKRKHCDRTTWVTYRGIVSNIFGNVRFYLAINFDILYGGSGRQQSVCWLVLIVFLKVSVALGQVGGTPVGAVLSHGTLPFPSGFMRSVKDYGAAGDGVSDDTAAIQAALADGRSNASSEYNGVPKALYFPPGTYLVRNTLDWNGCCVTLQGAGPSASVIRLAPSSDGYGSAAIAKAVVLTPGGNSSFRQNIRDIGFSIGAGNPGAVGIDYVSNNNGSINDVSIVSEDGQGITGISLTRHYPGPLMIKNVLIHGFQMGINTAAYEYGATIESITLENQTVVGINNVQQTISIRGLKSTNTVPVLINNGGFAILIGARLLNGASTAQAIQTNNNIYLRSVSTTGYAVTLHDTSTGTTRDIKGTVGEYIGGSPTTLNGTAEPASLNLPVAETPSFQDSNLSHWTSFVPNFYGDTSGLQAVFNGSRPTVYFPFGAYLSFNEAAITVPDTVRRIVGFSSVVNGSTTGTNGGGIRFVVNGNSTVPLIIEQFGYGIKVEHHGTRPVVIKNGNYNYSSYPGAGNLFLEDVQMNQLTFQAGQTVWARQLNDEYIGTKITNAGSLWILGLKTEKSGVVINTTTGGQTELLGNLIYPSQLMPTDATAFVSTETRTSYIYAESVYCAGCGYTVQVMQTTNGNIQQIDSSPDKRFVMPLFYGH